MSSLVAALWHRGLMACAMFALATAAATPIHAQRQQPDAAYAALESGDYGKAISQFRRAVRRAPTSSEAVRGLVEALTQVGRYDEAREAVIRFDQAAPSSAELATAHGIVLYKTGKVAEALAAFTRAAGAASDSLSAKFYIAELRYRRGETREAFKAFDQFIDVYNRRINLSSADLTAVASAVSYLSITNWQLAEDAQRAFDEAVSAGSSTLSPRIRQGELFLAKFNGTDALAVFEEVLAVNPQHPRGLIGLARTLRFNSAPNAMDRVKQALEINPNFVPGRILLAELHIELEEYDRAAREIERALEINPASLEALAVQASIRYLTGDRSGFDQSRQRALSLNPRFADLYVKLAELAARNRFYRQASDFASQAVQLDSLSWRGYALLGINQLRNGQMRAGRASLETTFGGDPFDVWTKNTLDLLDTLEQYDVTKSAHFEYAIDPKESELLWPYVSEVAEEAYATLAARYAYEPHTPIRVEVYASHADFSVRTIGLAGIGALGVSFGPVVAMDSPSARPVGQFNWGSTLWHEIAHTFHLGMSEHHVPRWYTEGLAVYEERRAKPGWGNDVSPAFLAAYQQGRLFPVSQLNNGFMRPEYPEQVTFSYYQASLVCEFIEREHGEQALVEMLLGYRRGMSSADVFRSVLNTDPAKLDKAFDRYIRQRFATPLSALSRSARGPFGEQSSLRDLVARADSDRKSFVSQLLAGRGLVQAGRGTDAIPYLERAKELFPEYAADDSPYWHLAQIHKERGMKRRAADELAAMTSINARNYRAHVELADLLEGLNDQAGAAEALDRAMFINPLDTEVHKTLAELSAGLGQWERAVRERRAVLALDPVDLAEALYQLAWTHFHAGDDDNARRAVLRALERAPDYEEAQDLLLEIHNKRTGRTGRS